MIFIADVTTPSFEAMMALVGVSVIFVGTVGAWWDHRAKIRENALSVKRVETLHQTCLTTQTHKWDELGRMLMQMDRMLIAHDTKLDILVRSVNGSMANPAKGKDNE